MGNKRTPGEEIKETGKLIFRAFCDPDFWKDDPSRDHEAIISTADCATCGNEPMFRANGIQVRCPTCGQMPEPKAELRR